MSKKPTRGRRPGAEMPLKGGLLDAYTESSAVTSGLSDSDRFKEGYTKKNKKGAKTTQQRKSESETTPPVEPQPVAAPKPVEEVIDSWEDIEAEAMPVPIKVKQALRKEEKRNKAKMQQQKVEPSPEAANKQADKITEGIKAMNLEDAAPNAEKEDVDNDVVASWEDEAEDEVEKKQEEIEIEQKQVMADREAKKAAKAAAKAAAAEKKKSDKAKPDQNDEKVDPEIKIGDVKQVDDKKKCDKDSETKPSQDSETKSKAELKAERRAKQEAQRAAKAQAQAKPSEAPITDKEFSKHPKVPDDVQADRACVEKKLAKKLASQQVPARTKAQRKVQLFSHLHQYEREISATRNLPVAGANLHPLVLQLGLQYAEGTVTGSEGRCVALLTALKTVISEYLATTDKSVDKVTNDREEKDVRKDLDSLLSPNITFLKQCRPLAISMQNAIRFLKKEISILDRDLSCEALKDVLEERIEAYIHENIELAAEQISMTAASKINDGDVILTYSSSNLIEKVFTDAAAAGKKFKVIVSDGRVRCHGRSLAVRLAAAGIHTTYILITAITAVLPSITKVLLGCHGVFANGCVMAHIGSSQVALMAKSAGKPVLFCCETYKFTEKVQTDSFVYNELADPDDLVNTGSKKEHLDDWRDYSSLCLLNLMYDVTPASLVDAVITEISIIPTTSVPVILRLKHMEGSLVV